MIRYETVIDFLQEYGKLYIKGNKINARCPICGDSKKTIRKRRFTVTYEDGNAFYNCFNCDASGTFAELVSLLKGIPIGEAIKQVETIEFDDIKKILNKKPKEVEVAEQKDDDELSEILEDCISVDDEVTDYYPKMYKKALIKFIEDRKIPKEYKLFVAIKGEYMGRIIIPIYHNDDIVYFQGRAISKDAYLKFMNPEVDKTGIIMNVDKFKRDKYIIVTEGIVDAMMIEGHQGTCVLGGSVSDEFLSTLFKYTDKGVIIAVDNDERGKMERTKLLNSQHGKKLRYFTPPKGIKDINELKVVKNIQDMYNHIVSHRLDYFTLSISTSIKK